MGENVKVVELWRGATLSQDGVLPSDPVDLRNLKVDGFFALHLIFASGGAATVTVTYTVSPTKEGTYLTPADADDIGTTLAVGSHHEPFSPILTPFIKIVVTEDDVAALTSVDGWLVIQ